ncbi:hypothetical protein KC19_3G218000 [Ceratodon purpureus]|uniref:Uncharacterized protein n=1 Tax=Ceratodon purpureus TaxID=3225 RepID=A0A8T0IP06_CERPU|nr:hypothetical protein KC19_3G218000 [Ceratodon purpureus]
MEKETTERRRSWLWKKRNGLGEGATSPTPVKLFDEQEVARILEDQVRLQKEQMDLALREVDEKYSEKEKTINEKLDAVSSKLTSALAEITIKDNLVKEHIRVAEEAVIGWERAENETASFKLQLDDAVQQKLATEDRVQHLDSALKEATNQLRIAREEQEQRIHEIIVNKTHEYDELRAEMDSKEQRMLETVVKKETEYDKLRAETESKLADASHKLDQTRAELMESRLANQAFSNALQERSDVLAEVSNARTRAETNIKVLQMRLEGMEKENVNLKDDLRVVTKRLEYRMSELEHAKKATDVVSKQLAEALKKVTKVDEECARLRTLVRKKPPSTGNGAVARLKQDVDPSGRDAGRSPRRRPLGRNQIGADLEENFQAAQLEAKASAEKILNLQEETRTLKEILEKRDEELQRARIMCAKTASRLTSVEEEVEALKSASRSASQVEKASPETWASNASSILSESSLKILPSKRDSLNFELMDDFEEMERLARSQFHDSCSVSRSELSVEADVVFAGLEEALARKDKDLEAANQMCDELKTKLVVAEEQLVSLQSKNAATEQSVIDLQYRLDSLMESQAQQRSENDRELALAVKKLIHITEALAQATGTESTATRLDHHKTSLSTNNPIVLSLQWQDPTLDTSMNSLVLAANTFLQTGADVLKFFLELTTTLDCILIIHIAANEELRNDRDASAEERLAVSMELESARVQVSQLEEELCRKRAEQVDTERKVQVEMARFSQFEAEVQKLKTEKNELEHNLSEMDQHLVEANDRVESLRVRMSDAEALVAELQTRQVEHDKDKEEDLIEQELMELSDPGMRIAANMRAADEEMHQLHDKVAALEVELHGERRRHQEVVAKLEDMQEQIHRGVGRVDHSPGRSHGKNGDHLLQLALVEDDATKNARKEKDIAAAALAECQRTILALGKQLKVLGLQEPSDISQMISPASPDSIEQMTHTMEFLRSQADSDSAPSTAPGTSLTWAPRARPALPGLYYRQNNNGSGYRNDTRKPTDGPLLLSIELPDSSNSDTTQASTASPARVLRSVRTIRGSASMKTSANDHLISPTNVQGITSLESRSTMTTSSFKRFYARSQSETSMSSDNSSPELVI